MYDCNLAIYNPDKCAFFALGRNAIYAACRILGLGEQDEVLTPAYDCDTTLQPFRVMGVKLKFFRTHPYTLCSDIQDIKKKITPHTKLIHVINHFGLPQPWDEILALRQESGIAVLEDNAYSLFSSVSGKPFGTFGDFSIFSLRKNLPLTDGGMLRINNPKYSLNVPERKSPWCHCADYRELLRLFSRKLGLSGFLKPIGRIFYRLLDAPPPLYSEAKEGYPEWPLRDVWGKEFAADYLKAMSKLARKELSKISREDFTQIVQNKRKYYLWLADKLKDIKGIEVLWPRIPGGIAPYCLLILISHQRDIFLENLRRKYDVMAWPVLSRLVLAQLNDFPEVGLLGRKLLQINLAADRVMRADFLQYLKRLVAEINKLSAKHL